MTTHRIELTEATEQRSQYGITHLSTFVYQTTKGSYPTRIMVWTNVNRPNPRNGEPVRFGEWGPRDGGNGQYLNPGNVATDEAVSVLLSPESTSITAERNGTGHPDSGQVYATQTTRIAEGDLLELVYPDGSTETRTVKFSNNGHGDAVRV